MQPKRSFLPIFIVFLLLSGLFFFLSRAHLLPGENFLQNIFFPIEGVVYKVVSAPFTLFQNSEIQHLQQENQHITQQLIEMQKLQQDNAALRDQFQTSSIPSMPLLPAEVIGEGQFLPGINSPEELVINKGSQDGVRVEDTIIYTNNVVGSVVQVTDHAAQVALLSSNNVSFLAKTSQTNAQGVLSGQGGGVMVLGNVVLSDTLKVGDIVVTGGSQDIHGKGFPPGLIVGKIVSIHKTPSSLYQSASVESLLNVGRLTTVFIEK